MSFADKSQFVVSDEDMAQAMSNTLNPCPFCGGKALPGGKVNQVTDNLVYMVFCQNNDCRAMISVCLGKIDTQDQARTLAIARWNKRTAVTKSHSDVFLPDHLG